MQLREVTAMGWVFSPINAIISLLRVEYQSLTTWLPDLLIAALYHFDADLIDAATCVLGRRFINDLYDLIAVEKRLCSAADIIKIIQALDDDTGLQYLDEFDGRLLLTCVTAAKVDYLDISLRIDSTTNRISSRIFEKISKINALLHFASNSPFSNYLGLYSSAIFRFVTLNSKRADFELLNLQFYGKL